MKRFLLVLISLSLVSVGIFCYIFVNSKPFSKDTSLYDFVIPKGAVVNLIGKKLKDAKLVRSNIVFKIYVQFTGRQGKIQAGEYRISPSWNMFQVVDQFIKGPSEIWVTIPEGLRKEEIAQKFISILSKKGVEADSFRKEFLDLSKDKEGFLFPDTYLFPKEVSAGIVFEKMISTFEKRVDIKLKAEISKSSYSLDEVIIMASLIERETKKDEERPIVAGILYKRLSKNWPLQVDASLQYAVADRRCLNLDPECDWWKTLTKADLSINSTYNSYKLPGLPPTPIANPGLSAIKAAVFPQVSPYWFYLHDNKGQVHYAETLEEHNQNVRLYLNK